MDILNNLNTNMYSGLSSNEKNEKNDNNNLIIGGNRILSSENVASKTQKRLKNPQNRLPKLESKNVNNINFGDNTSSGTGMLRVQNFRVRNY